MDEYVSKYEVESHGEKVLWVPRDSDQLLVLFSSFKQSTYIQLRSHSQDNRMNLLFVRDLKDRFYIEEDRGERYAKIIGDYAKLFSKANVFFYGSSMGGYGALYHGINFGGNVLTYNPQVSMTATARTAYKELRDAVLRLDGNFVDIADLIRGRIIEAPIYYMHGKNPVDATNAAEFFGSKVEYMTLVSEGRNEGEHYIDVPIPAIYARLEILKALRAARFPPKKN